MTLTKYRREHFRGYPNLICDYRLPKGGHFAVWEQPAQFAGELRGVKVAAAIE